MINAAKKVLVVAYFFPPVGGAGVQRPLKFVKYLKQLGWNPAVLTAENPSVPTLDEGLLRDLPADVKIYKAPTLEPSYAKKQKIAGSDQDGTSWRQKLKSLVTRFFIPDMQILWWPGLILHLTAILRADRPDVIFVTAPPFSSLVPVTILGKVFRVAVVVDFRDEWVFARKNIENAGRGAVVELFDHWLEKLTVWLCADFSAATQSYVDSIRERHGKACRGKGRAITNGYDEDDFSGVERKREEDGIFRILYAGTVWKATSLQPFVDALNDFIKQNPSLNKKIRLRIVGRIVESERHYLEPLKDNMILEEMGYMDHDSAIQEMFDADLLLLTLSDLPGAERIIPGKFFEYIATQNNIMSIVPDGEVSRMVNDCPCGHTCPPDKKAIVEKLKLTYSRRTDITTFNGLARYSRHELTAKLNRMFEKHLRLS